MEEGQDIQDQMSKYFIFFVTLYILMCSHLAEYKAVCVRTVLRVEVKDDDNGPYRHLDKGGQHLLPPVRPSQEHDGVRSS